jgi:AcrR family transcriptional regulator
MLSPTGQEAREMDAKQLTERQARIVDAALRIIATRGSRRFTADLLAREVGLTGGALYRHFGGMNEVVDAVVDRVGEVLFEGFPPGAGDPLERLKLFYYRRARAILMNPHISRLLLSDHLAQAGGAAQSRRLDEFKRRSRDFVMECLRNGKDAGMLAGGMSPEAGAVVVLGSILAMSHAAPRVSDGTDGERLFDEVWSGIERMLRGPAAAAQHPTRAARAPRRSAKGRAGAPGAARQ